jgi:elongation factor 3
MTSFSKIISTTADEQALAISQFVSSMKEAGSVAADIVSEITSAIETSGKASAGVREGAFLALHALLVEMGAAVYPLLVSFMTKAFIAVGDKMKSVPKAASVFAMDLVDTLPGSAVPALLEHIVSDVEVKWQGNVLKLEVLNKAASLHPDEISRQLTTLIPFVSDHMWNDKRQVKDAAIETMKVVSNTMTNGDIESSISDLIAIILDPTLVDELIQRLAGIIFVQEIRSEALSIMLPVLTRSLAAQSIIPTKRMAARVVDNMSKLVDEPKECQVFLPKVLPLLEQAMQNVPDPECREVCEKAVKQLKVSGDMSRAAKGTNFSAVATVLDMDNVTPEQKINLAYAAHVVVCLADLKNFDATAWSDALRMYIPTETVTKLLDMAIANDAVVEEDEEDDGAELLCDCNFSLAFGSKILMNNTKLKLQRGKRYGLIGKNDCGKTSLMRAIANNQIEGFPDPKVVRTAFVETDVQGDLSELTVLEYLYNHPMLANCGVSKEDMSKTLISVGFGLDGPASIDKEVGRLSGGWRMKLALARAMLLKADILLLDEPTNHLDPMNRKWVEEYLTNQTNVSMIMVSHDAGFLERVCTNMMHIDNLKIKTYAGSLAAFVEKVPEAKAFFELTSSEKYKFKFPEPGNLEGITSKGKHIMKMSDISFTYPSASTPQLNNVSVRVSLSSRVACVGANGAGKSTMIKLLTGELVADKGSGEVWKHPNARVAYVAQHAFVHIENHLEKTPNEYIRWRYQYTVDKEALKKDDMTVTEEELKIMKQKIQVEIVDVEGNIRREKRVIKELTNGRRQEQKGKNYEYECLLEGGFDQKIWQPAQVLRTMGWVKAMKEVDERVASIAAQYNRPLTSAFVEKHIMDVGLEREFATHTRMSALSGGQKVKVVLAAALWKAPHIIILDEPTNYLDRESLGALADAIKEFEGGIVIVSHNNEFCKACCPETWIVENHTLDVQGDPEWLAQAEKEKVKDNKIGDDDLVDAFGNSVTIQTKKIPTRSELKKMRKAMAKRRKEGEEVWTDEEMERNGYLVTMDVA